MLTRFDGLSRRISIEQKTTRKEPALPRSAHVTEIYDYMLPALGAMSHPLTRATGLPSSRADVSQMARPGARACRRKTRLYLLAPVCARAQGRVFAKELAEFGRMASKAAFKIDGSFYEIEDGPASTR